MKHLLAFMALCCLAITTYAQPITADQWKNVIGYLQKEDWKNAAEISNKYLASLQGADETEDQAATLRYMIITCYAGLMNEGKLTQAQALKNVKMFEGKTLVTPWRTVKDDYHANYIGLSNGKADTLRVMSTNNNATSIFAFEIYIPQKPLSLADYNNMLGKTCRIRGRLQSISVEGNILPRYRMTLKEVVFTLKD